MRPMTVEKAPAARRSRVLLLSMALAWAAVGDARAQSSTTPPPTAPSAAPMGGASSAPADPGAALPPAGGGSATPAGKNGGTVPLRNATTPPGITKPGQ